MYWEDPTYSCRDVLLAVPADFDTTRMIEGLDNKYAYYYIDGLSVKILPKPQPK